MHRGVQPEGLYPGVRGFSAGPRGGGRFVVAGLGETGGCGFNGRPERDRLQRIETCAQQPDRNGDQRLDLRAKGFAIGRGWGGQGGEGAVQLAIFGLGQIVEGQGFQRRGWVAVGAL